MTKPEKQPDSANMTRERGMTHGIESMRIYDAGQETIKQTRRLLNELACYVSRRRGQEE